MAQSARAYAQLVCMGLEFILPSAEAFFAHNSCLIAEEPFLSRIAIAYAQLVHEAGKPTSAEVKLGLMRP